MKIIGLILLASSIETFLFCETIEKRFVPGAQTASISGNWALWHNPAGLSFMGGGESALAYLYEWSEAGNRHHGGANVALNLWSTLTFAGGFSTQAAFAENAKSNLGTDLNGIFGAACKLSKNVGFGISFLKSHSFLKQQSGPTLISFGLQARPLSFLSIGGHYEEVSGGYFAAPNITGGVSIRPFKEFVTLGIDSRWVALGKLWSDGFRIDPIFSIKASMFGYQAQVSAEIPGLKAGFKKPIFSLTLDFNLAHLGFGFFGLINTKGKNFGVGGNIRTSSEEWSSIAKKSGLWVELTIDSNGTLEEKPASLAHMIFTKEESPLSVLALLKRIETDQSIKGVILNINGFGFGSGRTQEWRDAIVSLVRAKKEVILYLDSPSERDYYIATAATKIYMNRQSTLSLKYFQATLVYYADLLEKIGVKADAIVAGKYKTAPRQWTNARPQNEEIEIANNILNDFYNAFLTEVSSTRNIDREILKNLFNDGEINADEAKRLGLVDELVDANEVADAVSEREKKPLRIFTGYDDRTFKQEAWHRPKKIVVLPINDTIVDGRAFPGIMSSFFPITGAKDVIDEIEDAVDDDEVVGLIVRIDSPGGDAAAGHKINHALVTAQKSKPVIASMSDVAASAAYLVATGTNQILAMPNTITGSIGVFSLMFSGEKLAQKIGVFSKELSPLRNPGPTVLRAITEAERRDGQKIVDWFYQNFIQAVSTDLSLDEAYVKKYAEGRVWLGHEALEHKLVHELGGFTKAIDNIRLLLEIPEDEELTIEIRSPGQSQQFSLGGRLLSLFQSKQFDIDMKRLSSLVKPYAKALEAYRLNATPQARLPFDIEWPRKQRD